MSIILLLRRVIQEARLKSLNGGIICVHDVSQIRVRYALLLLRLCGIVLVLIFLIGLERTCDARLRFTHRFLGLDKHGTAESAIPRQILPVGSFHIEFDF